MDYEFTQKTSGMPLYDVVKLEMFTNYVNTLKHFRDIEKWLVTGQPLALKDVDEFIGDAIALYVDLRPKLEYPQFRKDDQLVKEVNVLKSIFEPLIGEVPPETKRSAPDLYKRVKQRYLSIRPGFLIMRTVLEEIGLTKVERPQDDPSFAIGRGFAKGSKT